MALRSGHAASALALVGLSFTQPALAQTVSAEVDVTAGASTDDVVGLATQMRLFGEVRGWRFFGEAAWAQRRCGPPPPGGGAACPASGSDVFGAAYPYNNRLRPVEVYVERLFHGGRSMFGVKGGRYRTPFGISSRSDHAYGGFLRAPLIRYDNYFALSNNFLEHGASVLAGVPELYVEVSLGAPADMGDSVRRRGLNTIVRAQAYRGPLVIGISHSHTRPYQPISFARGHADFTGVDGRWMQGGVQVRGEWIYGHPFAGTKTYGGYVDLLVHRRGMGPVTLVGRAERLDYDTRPPRDTHGHRFTAGGRVRLPYGFTAQVGVIRQGGDVALSHATALDFALTYSLRRY